jgi:hypothetical protein
VSHGETDLSDQECVDLELIRDTGRILRATLEEVDGSSRKGSRIVEAVYEVLIERRSGVRQSTSAYLDSAVRDRDFLLTPGDMPSPLVGDKKQIGGIRWNDCREANSGPLAVCDIGVVYELSPGFVFSAIVSASLLAEEPPKEVNQGFRGGTGPTGLPVETREDVGTPDDDRSKFRVRTDPT